MATVPRPTRRGEPMSAATAGPLTIVADQLTFTMPVSAFTLEGFREWATSDDAPERVRVTFIDGEVTLDMSNEEINAHVLVKTEVSRVLATLVKEYRLGKFFGDGMLVSNVEGRVSNNPDSAFVSRTTLESAVARPIPRKGAEHLYRELEGTPAWVMEIVSDSSVRKDNVRLREAYHAAGIPEYWLIDARGDQLLFHILLRRKTNYVAAPLKDGWQRSRAFGRSFRLVRQLDDFGMWEYTLEVRDD